MKELTLEQMQKLNTNRLLQYKRGVNRRAYKDGGDDFYDCDCKSCKQIREAAEPWKEVKEEIPKDNDQVSPQSGLGQTTPPLKETKKIIMPEKIKDHLYLHLRNQSWHQK